MVELLIGNISDFSEVWEDFKKLDFLQYDLGLFDISLPY